MNCNTPVSYTHLDVYKRQVYINEGAWEVEGVGVGGYQILEKAGWSNQ